MGLHNIDGQLHNLVIVAVNYTKFRDACSTYAIFYLWSGIDMYQSSDGLIKWGNIVCYGHLQVWSAYKDQRHDLFLPWSVQSAAAGVADLIENSSPTLTYALTAPPPQAPAPTTLDSNGKESLIQ